MSDVKRLLDEIDPRPSQRDRLERLLLDYEAAVDALEQCNRALTLRPPDPTEVDAATAAARAALRRLRGDA